MPENVYEYHYRGQDIAAAQRTRFFNSTQLKVILLLWLGTIVYLILPIFLPGKIPGISESSWAMVMQISLAYLVTLAVLIFVTPWLDYLFRRFWHIRFELRFNEKMMRVNVAGKPGGMRLQWGQLRRVLENKHVFIIEYDTSSKYLILPKSAFTKPGSLQRFRGLIERRNSIPMSTGEIEDEDEAQGESGAAGGAEQNRAVRKARKKKKTAKR